MKYHVLHDFYRTSSPFEEKSFDCFKDLYKLASGREPCEGSRHFIENGRTCPLIEKRRRLLLWFRDVKNAR